MINLTYILGGYIIGGALSYLYAEHNIHKDISHFKQSLLYTLGFIFRIQWKIVRKRWLLG